MWVFERPEPRGRALLLLLIQAGHGVPDGADRLGIAVGITVVAVARSRGHAPVGHGLVVPRRRVAV